MELDAYLRSLTRWWYIPVILFVISIGGVWLYHNVTGTKEAQATVVVLQSFFPGPGEFIAPQIGFDSVDESGELANRVSQRLGDGTEPEALQGSISIEIVSNLNRPNPSLLYGVKAEDQDGDRAIHIANIAVEEGRKLFEEINTPDARDVRAAYSEELTAAENEVIASRGALNQFEQENNAYGLAERIGSQLELVSDLRANVINADAALAGSGTEPAALDAARTELNRLLQLLSQYNQLEFEVDLAQASVATLEQRESDLLIAGDAAADLLAETQARLAEQRTRLTKAQEALGGFETANNASQLPAAVQTQQSTVNQLTISQAGGEAGSASYSGSLQREEAELTRQLTLQPEYDKLQLEVSKAEGRLATLEQNITNIEAGRTLPIQADVKVLDEAALVSNLWWQMITYSLAIMLATFLSLTAVYLLGYFRPQPLSARDIEELFGSPVLARIPRAPK
jgi:capsular polysaccharide biosynthesis protein